ncbi:HAD-IC family P-type ATPase [Gordonia sp. (in: high G+C Gram-positive bacteria)]|uniref:cation-translocating P-type ATPase n=1 Tax=Gordonia sp. (in: high G+C Gram-positive bacteria) TaxID=84139 RepID=UPI003527E177
MTFLALDRAFPALVSAPVRLGGSAVALPGRMVSAAAGVARATAGAVGEAIGGTPVRRVSRSGPTYWIEVRGLDLAYDRLAAALRRRLEPLPGVTAVTVNGPLARVLVTVDDDGPGARELCAAVATAEDAVARQVDGVGVAVVAPAPLPGDDAGLVSAALGTGITGAAVAAATIGSVLGAILPLRGLGLLTAPVSVAAFHPTVRAFLADRIGPQGTDLLLRSASGAAGALGGRPLGAVVNTGLGVVETVEALTARRRWDAVGPQLAKAATAAGDTAPPPGSGPAPVPQYGRRYERLSANSGLAAAAVIGAAGTGRQAAEMALVGAPKAARTVRETFAARLARGLQQRHGAVVLNPRPLRGLAEIDTLLIDPRALFTDRLRIIRVSGVDATVRAEVWHRAERALAAGELTRGRGIVHTPDGDAEVLVAPVRQPLAPALLMAARRAGLRVHSVTDDGYGSLHHAFDHLYPAGDDIDADLARAARELGDEGHRVALLGRSGTQAPLASALSIGLLGGPDISWTSDILVPGLDGAWRLLAAVPEAVAAAERGMSLSVGGSALGALMVIPNVPGNGPGYVDLHAMYGFRSGTRIGARALAHPVPAGTTDDDWHAMPISEVARRLPPPERDDESSPSGLRALTDRREVAIPRAALARARGYLGEFTATMRDDLNDPITPILTTGAAASALLGSPLDAAMVGGVLALNTAISAQQSLHAERLLARMLKEQDPLARRISGISDHTEYAEVRASRLLPGDIIEVRSGEVVPADGRIIDADNAEVDESSLTGESLPVTKNTDDTPGAPLAERTGMLYAGTTMVAGKARAIVTAVGASTEASRALALSPRQAKEVGLAAQLGDITRRALPWSFAGGAAIGALSLLRRRPIREVASGAVSIAVAAVPEGLPLVVTLAQSASARRLTGSSVLVRNPRAIEAFARLKAVCFDKTGTLSENRLRVDTVVGLAGHDDADVLAVAGETMLVRRDGSVEHATDAAIHAAAGDADITFARPDVLLPFQSERPYAAALVGRTLMVKGAPEAVLGALKPAQQELLRDALGELAARGLRVLAVAERQVTPRQAALAADDAAALEKPATAALNLIGVIGLSDTPRPAARPLIEALRGRGIQVRIITGDHPVTAAAVAGELGLEVAADEVMTGEIWDGFTADQRIAAARTHVVFARMSPEHKVQVVQALEEAGLVTAMVGDGANDAAAIRAASVGIGVASGGSDPARIAADVMLLDGDISGIIDALDEGEQLWRRVLSAISVLLGHSVGELAFGLITTLLTGKPALNARQMMLVNMLTDALPAAALAVSPQRDPDVRGAHDESTIYRAVAVRATFTTLGATLAWALASMTGRQRRASTVGLVGLVASQMLEMLADSDGPLVIATNVGTFALMGVIVTVPGLSHLFGCAPIGPVGWSQALLGAGVAAAVAKLLPDAFDALADALSGIRAEEPGASEGGESSPGVDGRPVRGAEGRSPSGVEGSVVDDEDTGPDQDGVEVLDGRREEPHSGVDEGVRAEGTSEVGHDR